MCTGLELALLGSAVSTGAGMAGQNSQRKQSAYAQQQQTEMSAAEFDKRNQLAKEIFGENFDLSKAMYDELSTLDDQAFQERTGLSKQAFNQLTDIDRQQVIRDAAASDANLATISQARLGRDATRDDARTRYNQILEGANTRQDQFRSEGDTVASDLLAAFTPGAMEGRRVDAVSGRDALVDSAVTREGSAVPLTRSADPRLAAAYQRYSKKGVDSAVDQSRAYSRVAGYGDAVTAGDRSINQGKERTAFITDAARRALAPLGAQLGAQSLRYNDAADAAAATGQAADADLAAALGLSQARAGGDSRAVTSYTGAMDDALAKFFGDKSSSISGRGEARIGANNTRLAGSNSVSQNLENAMGGITQFRMNSTSPGIWGPIGQFSSAVTPSLWQSASKEGFRTSFSKPAAG